VNIILIVCDTLRRDHVGCYGGRAHTPNIDRLAARSVVIDQAVSGSFPTLPCRADVATGRFVYPYLTWGPLPRDETVLAELLGAAGYDTALVSDNENLFEKNYSLGYERGFFTRIRIRGQAKDRLVTEPVPITLPCAPDRCHFPDRAVQFLRNATLRRGEEDYCSAQVMRAAADWLEENAGKRPLFLMVDCFDPHEPWDAPQADVDRYDPGYEGEKLFYPRYNSSDHYTEPELRHMRALYAAEVTLVDRWLGHLLDRLDRLSLWEDTAVIFFSDHGFLLGEHGLVGKAGRHTGALRGWPLYREVAEVPMMASIPGVAPRRVNSFAQPADLMPTILELAGVARPERVQAVSLMPLFRGEVERVRDLAVSSWSLRDVSRHRPSTIRTEEWSLIFWRSGIPPELYHLPTDPGEQHSLYSKRTVIARHLHRRYVDRMCELETPARNYWPRRFLITLPGARAERQDLYPAKRAGSPAARSG
jgi:arylsulfatase A-like enzyme